MLTLIEFPAVCDAVRVAAGYAVVGEPLRARLRSLYLCVGCVVHPGIYVCIHIYMYIKSTAYREHYLLRTLMFENFS
jgi:hypothetical protein